MRFFSAIFGIVVFLAQAASGQTNMTLTGGPSSTLSNTNHPAMPPAPKSYSETQVALGSQPADLEQYLHALRNFASVKVSPHGFSLSQTPSLTWIQLAVADPSLAKAPNIKRLTLGLLNEGRNMEMVEKRLTDQSRSSSTSKASRPVVQNSSNNNYNRRPPKPPEFPELKQMEAMNKLQADAQRQRTAIASAAAKWIDAIQALKDTPEGQQFSIPADSAFYKALSSRNVVATTPGSLAQGQGTAEVEASTIRIEVTSQTSNGVLGYLKKIVQLPDGSNMKGSDGEYVYEADRTKTVIITGYPKSVSFGESLSFKARKGEPKAINTQTLPHYIYASER